MRTPTAFVYVIFGLLLLLPTFAHSVITNVSQCSTISTSGSYEVNDTMNPNGVSCITLNANDIDLNCRSFRITGNMTPVTNGIETGGGSYTNLTVRNCVVASFGSAISLTRVTNSNVSYNTVGNISIAIGRGISISNSTLSTVFSNTVRNVSSPSSVSGIIGIYVFNVNSSTFSANTVENSTAGVGTVDGIVIDDSQSTSNTITSNTLRNLKNGMNILGNNHTVSSNTITNITASNANSILYSGANGTVTLNTIQNSTINFTTGILVVEVSDNINVTSNTISNYLGRGTDIRGNNSLIAHNVLSNFLQENQAGISVGFAGPRDTRGNTIYNNSVSDSVPLVALGDAIHAEGIAYNVSYNNVTTWNGTGLRLSNSINSTAIWNRIINVTALGLTFGSTSSGNTIAFNLFTNSTRISTGVILSGQFNNFSYNNVTSLNTTLVVLDSFSSSSSVHDNILRDTGNGACLSLNTGSSNTNNSVVSNQISNCSAFAIMVTGVRGNRFFRNTLNQNFTNIGSQIFLDNASSNVFVDTQFLSNLSELDLDLIAGRASSNTFINSTFNLSRIRWDDAASNVTIQYYFDASVSNSVRGLPEPNVFVNVTNGNRTTTFFTNLATNDTGQISRQNLTVLFLNLATTSNHTPHNVTIFKTGWWNSSNFTITDNANVALTIASSCPVTIVQNTGLLNNVAVNGSTCFTFGADNLILDLNGFSVTGNKTTNRYGALSAERTNVTTRSGTIRAFGNGVLYSTTTNSTIFNVTFFNNTVGINGVNANNTNASNNNVSYSDQDGIVFSSSIGARLESNTIQDNTLSAGLFAGVNLLFTNSSSLVSNTFLRNNNSLLFNGTNDNRVFEGSVTNSTSRGAWLTGLTRSGLFSGVSFTGNYSNAQYRDVRLDANSSMTLHDVTFNKTSVSFDNAFSNITANWTVFVNVSNATSGLLGALVNWTARGSSSPAYSVLTNSSGLVAANLTEYTQNGSQVYGVNESTLSPYALRVSFNGFTSNSSSNSILSRTQVNVFLPAITSISASSITSSGATISWSTDALSNSTVEYGKTIAYDLFALSSDNVLWHSLFLTGLDANTIYHYRVTSCRPSGTCSISGDNTFTTLQNVVVSGAQEPSPTPSPAPTIAPITLPLAPSPTPAPAQASPTPQPTPSSITELVKEEEVVVEVEEPLPGEEAVTSPVVSVRHELAVQEARSTEGLSGTYVYTYAVFLVNKANSTLEKVFVKQRLPFIVYVGPSPDDYPDVKWDPKPIRIEQGSAVVTWLFDNMAPGEEVTARVTVNKRIERSEIEAISTPKVLAKAVKPKVEVKVSATVQPVTPAAAKTDYTMPIIVVAIVLVVLAAYFLTRKRQSL